MQHSLKFPALMLMLLIIFTLGFVFHCLYTAVLLVLVLLWVGASKKAAVIIALDYIIIFMLLHWVVIGKR